MTYVIRRRIMIIQNENRSPELWAKPSWRKDDPADPLYRADAAVPKRGTCVPEKGPTFLNAYVIPVLVLNLAVGVWTLIATHVVGGVMVYLGYALIITVGLRQFLAYLDSFGWCS
jgi:hypothetical protein